VEVRVNDRGPFAGGRILDVSAAAARILGMLERGLAKVRLFRCG
jgi:rare lipoprotein A